MLEVSQKSKQETRRVQPSFQLHIVTGGVETRENWPPYSAFSVYYHDNSVCKGVYLATAGHSVICRSH